MLLRWLAAVGWLPLLFPPMVMAADQSVQSYARAPAMAHATMSPSGAFLAYVEQTSDRQQVMVRNLRGGSEERTLDVESKNERIGWCKWADDRFLLCGTIVPRRIPGGVFEQTRLYAIAVPGSHVSELNTRLADIRHDQIVDFTAGRPGYVLLQHDETGRGYPEVSELNLATGALRRVVNDHPPVRRWMSNGRGNITLGIGYERGVATLHVFSRKDNDWTVFAEYSIDDIDAMGPVAFGANSDQLYVLKNHEGRTALFQMDLQAGPIAKLLFAHPVYDVAGPLMLEPASGTLLGVRYVAERERTHFFDADEMARQGWLDSQFPDAVNVVVDRTADGQLLLVQSASDVDPPSYYLADVGRRQVSLAGHQYPELEGATLVPMRSTTYRARDGQMIPAYLTLPPTDERTGLPAIVLPHGGPESRDFRKFDPLVQLLATRGYVVLQMNFRGSLGFGARFAAAGAGQWGGIIHNDITDGTRWLVEQGIADPARICIVGASFGGYAAMLGATRESGWYTCAASYAGVSDLLALSLPAGRGAGAELWRERLGDDGHVLWQMSPLARVKTAEIPMLLVHGRLDAVVPAAQSIRLARALRQAGKPVEMAERADCDHDMTIQNCRIFFFERLIQFLNRELN